MNNFANLDLFSVGIAVAAIGILGFVVFFNNRKSVTNGTFLAFAVVTIFWGLINYFDYHVTSESLDLWLTRLILFFAVWQAFLLYQFFHVLPNEKADFSSRYKFIFVPVVAIASLVTLSPFAIVRLVNFSPDTVPGSVTGPGMIIFGLVAIGCVVAGLVELTKKTIRAAKGDRAPFLYVLVGAFIMFALIIVLNFVWAAFLQDFRFIPLGAVFILPFVACATYAILRHHLLNVKVITTDLLVFSLATATLFEVVSSQTLVEGLIRFLEFALVLGFGISLSWGVRKEVALRQELQDLNQQIQKQNEKLEQLSRFKSELLSLASHQIRAPLAAIKGFVSLITEGAYGTIEPAVKEPLDKVKRSADDLLGLVNTLLDMRKVEEGRMEYQLERIDLADLVTQVVDAMTPLAEEKKLDFSFSCDKKPVWINVDKEKFKQVVQNLVDNAIKYTPAGFVRVELRVAAGTATVSISDSGLGISPTLMPYLFEEFIRDERVKKDIRGTGLGLYIARKIAEAQGGKMRAESAGEGKGSTFYITLPEIN